MAPGYTASTPSGVCSVASVAAPAYRVPPLDGPLVAEAVAEAVGDPAAGASLSLVPISTERAHRCIRSRSNEYQVKKKGVQTDVQT